MGEADFFACQDYMVPLDFDAKPFVRDLKIRLITEDINLQVKQRCVDNYSTEIDTILANFDDFIITGSLALNLYGLLNRSISDIDIILFENKTGLDLYGEDNGVFSTDRLGFCYLSNGNPFSITGFLRSKSKMDYISNFVNPKKEKFDLFLDKDKERKYTTFTYNGKEIKVHNPIEIIEQKIVMYENHKDDFYTKNSVAKNKLDLWRIFKTIDSIS